MRLRATLANVAWLTASAAAHRRFVRALRDPAAAQDRWLRAHLARHGACAYGRAHGCHQVRSYEEFARQVPIVSYDDLQPWIARIQRGEQEVLGREPVTRLLPTSGSTGARKLIPFTATLQREFNAGIGPWIVDLYARVPALAFGPAYWSVTPLAGDARAEPSAVPIGFEEDARHLGGARAWLIDAAMAVPSSVRHLRDLATFRRTVLYHLIRHADLRLVSVWHPSFFSLLLDALVSEWDWLGRELVRHGQRGRARALRRADPVDPLTVWPNLRVVSCWTEAHAAGSAAELQRRLPRVRIQSKGLLATEACVTVPFAGRHPLALQSHFFEFIDEGGRVRPAADLRGGGVYEVVVTTGGGLWRYRLGDQVEVTAGVDRTPALRFLGRAGNVSDLRGEKLSEPFVAGVLARLCPRARFALLAPDVSGRVPQYVLYLEDEAPPTLPAQLEAALGENPHYALARDLGQLDGVVVRRIERGGYAAFVAAETARGRRLGDIKPVALSRRPDWARIFSERNDAPGVETQLSSPP